MKEPNNSLSIFIFFNFFSLIYFNINWSQRDFAKTLKRPFKLRYDPYTQSVKVIDDVSIIEEVKRQVDLELDVLVDLFQKINSFQFSLK